MLKSLFRPLYNGRVFVLASNSRQIAHDAVVWSGKPWVTPVAAIRTLIVVIVALLFLILEMYTGLFLFMLAELPIYLWTLLLFTMIWAVSMLDLLIFWLSNSYLLRQDGLEVKRGIIRLNSFVVTPSGFGDLSLYQGIGGRIFNYGDLTILSQGERKTKLAFVRSPFAAADTIRDVMGKPIVRVESRA